MREVFLFFLIAFICALGVLASAGAMNHSVREGWFFIIAGVVNLFNVVFSWKWMYKAFFKDNTHESNRKK